MKMHNSTIKNKPLKSEIQKLIHLNDELENYFANTIIPQLFVDANLILRKYSPPAMKHFRLSADHVGKNMHLLVDNIRYSSIIDNIEGVIRTNEIFEKEIQTLDLKWFQMNIIPYIIKKENRTNGVIITFIDITERIKDISELEQLNASHETFIYSVSHDLRGPLTNIEELVRLFTDAEFDNQQLNFAELLEKSVKTMKTIVNELSEITKIEGNYIEKIETVNFHTIIKEVELILKDKINASNTTLKLHIDVDSIVFSRKNIRSIFYNLLSNVIKYGSPNRDPEILVNIEKEGDLIVISIKDNGVGIAADKQDMIFSKFTRIQKNVEGTGIGLYLVNKIVENAGGKIVVTSKINEGSEFKVYLKQ